MRLSTEAQEAYGCWGIRCLPAPHPGPSYTQQATWYHHTNQRLLSGFKRERKRNRILCVGSPAPGRELCWCLFKLFPGYSGFLPCLTAAGFCKKSEGEFPLQLWLRTQDQEVCRQKGHYPPNIPTCLLDSTSSRWKAGQLAIRLLMEKMYFTVKPVSWIFLH